MGGAAKRRTARLRESSSEDEIAEDVPTSVAYGEIPTGTENVEVAFAVAGASNRLAAVAFMFSEAIEIQGVVSPDGVEYTGENNKVLAWTHGKTAWVALSNPEAGMWRLKAKRKTR